MSRGISDTAPACKVAAALSRSYRRLSMTTRRLALKLGMENGCIDVNVDVLAHSDLMIFKPAECSAAEALALLQTVGDALERIEILLGRMAGVAREAALPECTAVRRREHAARYADLAADISRAAEAAGQAEVALSGSRLAFEPMQIRPEQPGTGMNIHIPPLHARALGVGPQAEGPGRSVTTRTSAQAAVDAVDTALHNVRAVRAELEDTGGALEASLRAVRVQVQNLSSCASRVSDADVALDMLEFVHSHVLRQPSVSLLAQTNTPRMAMNLL